MTEDSGTRVVIVGEHALVRDGIASLLGRLDDITVVGTADSAIEALDRCGELEPDVALIELSMPAIDGVSGTALLRQRHPDLHIVVLADFGDALSVRAAVLAGASACLVRTVGVDELAEAIRGVTRGRSTFSSELLPDLVQQPLEVAPGMNLTSRERDILPLLAGGSTNKGIARELGLAEGTVRVYVSGILAKLGVANRTEASVVAIHELFVEPRWSKVGSPDRPR